MNVNKKVLWIGGWGINPTELRALVSRELVNGTHTVAPPSPKLEAMLAQSMHEFDVIIGYSLGAFLLLQYIQNQAVKSKEDNFIVPAFFDSSKEFILIAPFLDFKSESGKGGKVSLTQLRYLERMLKRSPVEAINDFYLRAQLSLPPITALPYPIEDLQWGISQLITQSITTSFSLPLKTSILLGEKDPLLDSASLAKTFNLLMRPNKIQLINNQGHDLTGFLKEVPNKKVGENGLID